MRLPFSSLYSNLVAAFAAVIFLTLLLVGGTFAYLVAEAQVEREKERLDGVARNITAQVLVGLRRNTPMADIASQVDEVAAASRVRIVLIGQGGLVRHDTANGELTGGRFALPLGGRPGPSSVQGVIETPSGERVFATVPGAPIGPLRVAVLTAAGALDSPWRELVPRLLSAALPAMLVALALAATLARSITRPVESITRASEAMARGYLDQLLAVPRAPNELGRLAEAFNSMAQEVSRSHRAQKDLLANVSHDLRTPLTSIQGFAGALVDGTVRDAEGARQAGSVIAEEAERMRRLVEDLLELGRIEAGTLTLAHEPLDLADLARTAERRFALRAEEAGVRLQVDVTGSVTVVGDAGRLSQVVDNLVENALRFTPSGHSIRLNVATTGREAHFSVSNEGSYIPPSEIGRVFERFYQVDRARAAGPGRGLGLAIAQEIVQAHGGRIWAESRRESGTTFTFALVLLGASDSLSSRHGLSHGPVPVVPARSGI